MKILKPISLLLLVLLVACDTYKPHNLLINPSFEEADENKTATGWKTGQHFGNKAYNLNVDTETSSHGKNSYRVEQFADQIFGIVDQEITLPERENKKFVFSAMLKTENVAEGDGWRLVINFKETDGYIIKQTQSDAFVGTSDWQKVTLEGNLPKGTTKVAVGAMMQSFGTGWVDEVEFIVD